MQKQKQIIIIIIKIFKKIPYISSVNRSTMYALFFFEKTPQKTTTTTKNKKQKQKSISLDI